jgi:hypothetical protein
MSKKAKLPFWDGVSCSLPLGLPKFGPEPRFEPRTAGPDLQVRAQVLLGGWFSRTGSNLEPKYLIWS